MRMTKQLMEVGAACLIGYDTYFIQVLTSTEINLCRTEQQEVTYVRRLLVDCRFSCRLSCTKGWYSALHGSISLPLVKLFSKSPTESLLSNRKGATSSTPTTIAGQKQLSPVLLLISNQRSTEHKSQIFRENDGHHGETLSVGTAYQLCPMQLSRQCRRESPSHRLHGVANDWGQRTPPIVPQVAMMKVLCFSAASSRQNVPILRMRGTLDLLQWRIEQIFLQLKRKYV